MHNSRGTSDERANGGTSAQASQSPWLDEGDLVRLVDGCLAIVLCAETGYFGTVYRVRSLDSRGEWDLVRGDLILEISGYASSVPSGM
jgi:hypothetical protein